MTVWICSVYLLHYVYAITTTATKHTSLLYQVFFECTIIFLVGYSTITVAAKQSFCVRMLFTLLFMELLNLYLKHIL